MHSEIRESGRHGSKRVTKRAFQIVSETTELCRVVESNGSMWTRGDGQRYMQPNYIYANDVDSLWRQLTLGLKTTVECCNEFASEKWDPIVILNNVVFIYRHSRIQYGTTSMFKGIWRTRNA